MLINKKSLVVQTVVIIAFLMITLSYAFPSLNYLRYFSVIPLIPFVNGKIKTGYLTQSFKLFLVFILCGIFTTILSFQFSLRLLAEILLVMLPLIFVIFFNNIQKINEKHIKTFFYITSLFMIVENFSALSYIFTHPSSILRGLITSQLGTESHFGFLFGLFFLYFFISNSKKRLTIIAFIFMVIALKRVVIGASVLSIVLYMFLGRKELSKSYIKNLNMIMFFGLILFVYVLINLSLGVYDDWIKINTGLSANHFTMGRASMYRRVLYELPIQLIGHGQGSVTNFMEGLNIENMKRLHSDFLKNFIELGTVIYTIWILFFNKINIFSVNSFVMLFYYWIVLATDNVFIYYDFLVLFYMIQSNFYEKRQSS